MVAFLSSGAITLLAMCSMNVAASHLDRLIEDVVAGNDADGQSAVEDSMSMYD